jgi:hypothetical protein
VARGVWEKNHIVVIPTVCGRQEVYDNLVAAPFQTGTQRPPFQNFMIYDSSEHLPKLMEHSINILSNSRIASGSSRGC